MLVDSLDNICLCTTKHVPKPTKLYILEVGREEIYVCPTTWTNIHCLMEKYSELGGRPPGSVRKHFSEYVQIIVERLINE